MAAAEIDALIEREIPALRRYAFALVRDHEAADDLVQECLERALSHWSFRRTGGDLRAWLFAILRNRHLDVRRSGRRRGIHVAIEDENAPGVPADQEARFAARSALDALDHLPEEQKSVLLLIGVEDLSYEDAARVLNVPVGTVMSRLSRARQRLRALVETGRAASVRRVK